MMHTMRVYAYSLSAINVYPCKHYILFKAHVPSEPDNLLKHSATPFLYYPLEITSPFSRPTFPPSQIISFSIVQFPPSRTTLFNNFITPFSRTTLPPSQINFFNIVQVILSPFYPHVSTTAYSRATCPLRKMI